MSEAVGAEGERRRSSAKSTGGGNEGKLDAKTTNEAVGGQDKGKRNSGQSGAVPEGGEGGNEMITGDDYQYEYPGEEFLGEYEWLGEYDENIARALASQKEINPNLDDNKVAAPTKQTKKKPKEKDSSEKKVKEEKSKGSKGKGGKSKGGKSKDGKTKDGKGKEGKSKDGKGKEDGKDKKSKDGKTKSKGKDGKGKSKGSKGKKGKKGKKKGKKKKKGPRCPIQRYKKALKNVCTNAEDPTAVLNSYFVCHGVQEMLKFRKFIWKKKQKPLEPEPKFNDKPWGF